MALPITIYPVRFSTCNERKYCRSRRFSCSLVNHDLHLRVILFCGFTETAGLPPGSAAHSLPALPLLLHVGGGLHHRLHLTRPVPLPLLCPQCTRREAKVHWSQVIMGVVSQGGTYWVVYLDYTWKLYSKLLK